MPKRLDGFHSHHHHPHHHKQQHTHQQHHSHKNSTGTNNITTDSAWCPWETLTELLWRCLFGCLFDCLFNCCGCNGLGLWVHAVLARHGQQRLAAQDDEALGIAALRGRRGGGKTAERSAAARTSWAGRQRPARPPPCGDARAGARRRVPDTLRDAAASRPSQPAAALSSRTPLAPSRLPQTRRPVRHFSVAHIMAEYQAHLSGAHHG
jgi:hypothetical protein